MGLLGITLNVVAPVFLIAFCGFLARRFLDLDPRPISRLALYVFVPALMFNSLLTTQIAGDELSRIVAFSVILTIVLIFLSLGSGRLLRIPRSETTGMTLAVSFMNTANYGLPVVLFAFGQDGFDRAVIFAAVSAILTYTLAVFVATQGRVGWRKALFPMLRLPVLWAAAAAVFLRVVGIELPTPVQRAVTLLSGGAIPMVVLLLGIQVAGLRIRELRLPVSLACVGRLLISPAIGLVLVALLQPSALTAQVLVLQAAMPTAVNVTLVAAEFDAEPDLVASVTLLTTILSLLTLTGWVAYLHGL